MPTPPRRGTALALGVALATGLALRTASRRARGVPLSTLHADGPIGPDWPDGTGLRGDPVPGEMDSMAAYARRGFDPDAVDPTVRALYERTRAFDMTLSATWHRPFRTGAALASRWTTRIEQLNLPGPRGGPRRVQSELFALAGPAAEADPRDDPRLWLRRDVDTGAGVFAAVYASHVADGERVVNIAVPLPGASLATVLRIGHHGRGVELTTDGPDGGLYLHTARGPFRLPASQRFRVTPADDPAAPAPPAGWAGDRDAVLAAQRIRLCGTPLVTVRYAAERA